MKKYVITALAALCMLSCSEKKFHVEGTISEAADSVLYLENVSLTGPVTIDSVRLGAEGTFSFSGAQAATPEFYRLRIAGQIINLCIDSTETVTVRAAYPTMAAEYEVEGSDDNLKIRELAQRQMRLQQQALAIQRDPSLSVDAAGDSLLSIIRQYKDEVKRTYIFSAPGKPYAYFALFQTLGDWLLFNPKTDPEDIKAFQAVATSWDTFYPGAERSENLRNIAITGVKNQRIVAAENARTIDASKVTTTGLIDIALTDNHGQLRHLTDLKGRVVLLDFHAFGTDDSPKRILLLRELYNKYHTQGLEIYQVSLDGDEHFWKQQTAALPWISVREPEGAASTVIQLYNVQALPEFFLIDRDNNLVGRSQQISDVDAAIRRLL
ncbi:MAG: DUF4369 domain-containing protein [Prevotella sp.]|nr:DUF4369 domain-containing protein [Prevotella sp.]